jgi:hypothetical protein
MERTLQWQWLAVLGIIGVAQGFVDLAPAGPWDSRSFTRGVLGLVGMTCLYLAWFRFTFNINGVAPTVDRWKEPEATWSKVIMFGAVMVAIPSVMQWAGLQDAFPEPTGLFFALIGGLALLNGAYVGLVVKGPLAITEEE